MRPGRYLVLEGRDDEEETAMRLRFVQGDPGAYERRPEPEFQEPSARERARELLHQIESVKVGEKKLVADVAPGALAREIAELEQIAVLEDRARDLEGDFF